MGHDGDDAWSAFKLQITYNYLKVTIFSDNFVQQFSTEALAIANFGDFHHVLCLRMGGGGERTTLFITLFIVMQVFLIPGRRIVRISEKEWSKLCLRHESEYL